MDVETDSWQRAGVATPGYLMVQNVGDCRIGFVFAASQPAEDAYTLDGHEHFSLMPGSQPFITSDLATQSVSMWVRALGPKNGKLSVKSTA